MSRRQQDQIRQLSLEVERLNAQLREKHRATLDLERQLADARMAFEGATSTRSTELAEIQDLLDRADAVQAHEDRLRREEEEIKRNWVPRSWYQLVVSRMRNAEQRLYEAGVRIPVTSDCDRGDSG